MKKMKNILIIVAILILAGAAAAYAVLSTRIYYNPEGTLGNTAGNLMNGGLFAELDGIIYFANPYDRNQLYSMESDCTNVKQLSTDTISAINVCDHYIFYIRNNFDEENAGMVLRGQLYGIVRTNRSGKQVKTLTTDIASELTLYENTLYYTNYTNSGVQIYDQSIDDKTNERVYSGYFSLAGISDGAIYYSGTGSDHNVYEFNLDNHTSSLYLTANSYMAQMSEGILYYIDLGNNYALTKYDAVSNETTVLYDGRCINYNVYDDIIFYQTEGTENALKRMNTDGTDDVVIVTGNVEHISCTSEYTFFNFYNQKTLYRVHTHGGNTVESIVIS